MPRCKLFGKSSRKRIHQNKLNNEIKKRKLKKLSQNPPGPKPAPGPRVCPAARRGRQPKVKEKKVPSAPLPVEVTGKRSCTLKKCAFNSCPNYNPRPDRNDEVTYFPFPHFSIAARRWARVVAQHNKAHFALKMHIYICSQHFPPWLITADGQGVPTLDKEAVPTAEPFKQEDLQNIEEVLLPNAELKEDSYVKVEVEDPDDEVKQAVNSLADIPPPENGLKLQCINLDNNENATLHYLSVDKDYTVNHTRVDIHKNNIATLHYVDTNNKVNHTLRCIDLNGDNINSYEELINPNITNTQEINNLQIEIPNLQDSFTINPKASNAVSNSEEPTPPDKQFNEETIQTSTDNNLDTYTMVKSEEIDIKTEVDDTIGETDDSTSQIQPGDDDDEENVEYIVKMEYESDDDS
ncbi:uncharacterized protein LOC123868579 isoform X2 [Maniola jurtina]|uniref:uncharacterized protein LOC123868579 isoform X2 n=1 Tax=Maniola jurtina TaxID=191418 RepID=UPI001E68E5B5|nr:uncharacterized protein LOC123868579 isoform X2 [Maniola jurtina]